MAEAVEMGKEYERQKTFGYLDDCKNKKVIMERIQCQYDIWRDTQADLAANLAGAQYGAQGASTVQECIDACLPNFPNVPVDYLVTDEFIEKLKDYHRDRQRNYGWF